MRKTRFFCILTLILIMTSQLSITYSRPPEVLFSDAWFGDENTRIEVEPGSSGVQLIVRLVNSWNISFRYVEGYLILPEGFRDSLTGSRKTQIYSVKSVEGGQYFFMKFLIDIDEDVSIGEYQAKLFLRYVFWDEENIRQTTLYIRFRVTGRITIAASLESEEIKPAETLKTLIKLGNIGTAPASSVKVSVEEMTEGLAIIAGKEQHYIGDLKPGEFAEIPITLLADRSLADRLAKIRVSVDYIGVYGMLSRWETLLTIKVSPLPGEKVLIDAFLEEPILKPSTINHLKLHVINRGSIKADSVQAIISMPTGIQPPITLVRGPTAVSLGSLNPGEEKVIEILVFANSFAAGGAYVIPLRITYVDDEGRHEVERSITVTVSEESRANKLSIYTVEYVRGGVVEDVEIRVRNLAGEPLRDITLTISPGVEWVTLLGPTTWHISSINSEGEVGLKVKIYVPSETSRGSTIGEPFTLIVEASFEDLSGFVREEAHTLGMYVRGIISLTLQELSVEMLGGDYFLVGRILNEGTETALFTRIMLKDTGAQTYLGDLDPNAPVLFSLPLPNTVMPGSTITPELIVTYMNSLREPGETTLEARVMVPKPVEESSESPQILPLSQPITLIIALIVAVIIALLAVRRLRKGESS